MYLHQVLLLGSLI